MLYVFRVDTGSMLQMDMNLALATVAELKDTIERTCRIAADKQVLLVSGGECLDLHTRVCHYSAGTDTNPIYLFSKNSMENRSLSPTTDSSEIEVTEKVEQSLELPSTYSTVVARASLAQSLCDLGKELARDCERLMHDQHLQQQGWAAAVANLEDMADFFRERSTSFKKDYQVHLDVREENLETLKNFNSELLTLSRIPILPPLLASAISLSGLDLETKVSTMTLLDWISAKDNQSSLQAVAEQCTSFLQQTDESVLEKMVCSVDVALDVASKTDMKEIKGLTERLCGLDQLMVRAKKFVQEQSDLAQGFQQNQHRVSNLGDASILPDLCASHRRQLLVMLENQTKLKDIRRRFQKAKEELSENLHHRLRWVAFAQNEMQAVGNNLMIYQESLKRGRRHLMIVRQVQRAPEMYCLAVAEVVRRRKFSTAFLRWANDLSNRLLATFNEESERRRDFKVQFGGHFLESLFPGLDDEPSAYATKAPEPFDCYIPDLSELDMETLRETLPELALEVSWTELSSVAQMFLSKSQVDKEDSKNHLLVEDIIAATVSKIGLSDKMDISLLRPYDTAAGRFERELESVPDCDEFENVSQCPLEKQLNDSNVGDPAETLGQQLVQASQLVMSATASLRFELNELRTTSIADKDSILELVGQIHNHIVQLTESYALQLSAMQDRHSLSLENTNSRICQLEKILEEKEASLSESGRTNSELRLEMECEIKNIKELHEKNIACLKETYRIREEESIAQDKLKQLEMEQLKESVVNLKINFEEKEKSTVEELNRDWNNKILQNAERHSELMNEIKAAASSEAIRLEERISDLEQRLVKTELTAEIEMENRVKELETEHTKACMELEERLRSQHNHHLQELQEKHQSAIDELTERLGLEHQTELQEVSSRLMSEYKTELGSLRSRFRLMSITSMEKSPSDSSLEKIERGDMIELVNHEAIVGQMREDAEVAQEAAVSEAVAAEQQRSKARLEECMVAAKARMEEEKQVWLQEAVTRAMADRDRQFEEDLLQAKAIILDERDTLINEAVIVACAEKDRHVEAMADRLQTLNTECQRHRDTIRRLTDDDLHRSGAGTVDPLVQRVENLEKEKMQLIDEIRVLRQIVKDTQSDERRRRVDSEGGSKRTSLSLSESESRTDVKMDDMSQSVAMEKSCSDVSELSRGVRNKMSRSMRDSGGIICLNSCNTDDPVLVLWNVEYSNYMILQDSPTLYFLHADCLDTLALRPSSDGSPRRLYAIATVVKKEYCNAKRKENRYRVASGTKFYRVLVKPSGRDRVGFYLPSLPSGDGDSASHS